MKKPIPVVTVIMVSFALMFSSCKKNYMCACTHAGGLPVVKFDLEQTNKKNADAACQAKKTDVLNDKYKCELYFTKF